MKLLIAIPSKGRADTIAKRSMRWLPRTGFDVRVFVEPQEYEAYEAALKDGDYNNYTHSAGMLIKIRKNNGGISYVMQQIKKHAAKNKYDLVFKMDDDIKGFIGRGKKKPDDQMIMDFCAMVGACRLELGARPEVGAVGFPYRNELFELKKWSAINARLQTAYIVRTKLMHSLGVNMMEDFAQYVYLRSQNFLTLRYGLLGIDAAPVGKTKGGMQLFDQQKLALEAAQKLRELHPGIKFRKVEGKAWSIEPVLSGPFFGIKKL